MLIINCFTLGSILRVGNECVIYIYIYIYIYTKLYHSQWSDINFQNAIHMIKFIHKLKMQYNVKKKIGGEP